MCYTDQSELETQSPYSPGIVENTEMLLRLGFCPEHIVNGEITPNAISSKDLETRGFSVYRDQYAEASHLSTLAARQGERIAERKLQPQEPLLSRFFCGEVRQIIFDDACPEVSGKRVAVVIDNADEDNVAHAAIFSTSPKRSHVVWLRNRLLPMLNNRVSLEAHFQTGRRQGAGVIS